MKILHLYPKSDDMIAKHVSMLAEGLRHSADVWTADASANLKTLCQQIKPDIVHYHGCWQYPFVRTANAAKKHGARIVISPHGQLEPWVMEENHLQEKLHKTLLWQRSSIEQAYALIAFGKMEQRFLQQLKWNPRIEIIRNAIITNSTTPKDMCSQTFAVYQKVIDSNVLEQMDDDTRKQLAVIIKAGVMGDVRWISDTLRKGSDTPPLDWRKLLIYAEHQNIRNYVDYGISILGYKLPMLDTQHIAAYFPEGYERPKSLKEIVGDYKGNETDYLLRMFQQIQKKPLLLHLIEVTRELYRDTIDDHQLQEALMEKKLYKQASRLMQILSELTLLDEGYMPLPPTDDKGTKQIRNLISNHLQI